MENIIQKLYYNLCLAALGLIALTICPLVLAENNLGLSAEKHGWEPDQTPSTADKILLLSTNTEAFVTQCRDVTCLYDEEKHKFKGIKLLGDFSLHEILKHEDGRPWITAVNEFSGEWVIVNPIRQTDMTMDCVSVGTMAHHGQDESTATDSICSIKGANDYTLQMSEALEAWVVDRNIEISKQEIKRFAESRKAHLETMGPDSDTKEGKHVYELRTKINSSLEK